MENRSFYNEILTEHNIHPEFKHDLPDANIELEGVNPSCGDDITLKLKVDGDVITDGAFVGDGCSISQASLSVMVDLVDGKTVDEAMDLEQTFHKLMESRGAGLDDENLEEKLGDAVVFQGVSKYPMRIKCALLGWEGLKDSIAKALAAKN